MTLLGALSACKDNPIAEPIAGPTSQAGGREALSYSGMVAEVSDALVFRLECCAQLLDLALVSARPDDPKPLEKAKQVMRAEPLHCTALTNNQTQVRRVWCNLPDGQLLSQKLLSQNLVIEDCQVSANQFGACAN